MEQFAAALTQSVPGDAASLLTYLFTEVLDGRNAAVADGVTEAVGRRPRDFSAYAAAGAWEGDR